jgi:hypothetical protein
VQILIYGAGVIGRLSAARPQESGQLEGNPRWKDAGGPVRGNRAIFETEGWESLSAPIISTT